MKQVIDGLATNMSPQLKEQFQKLFLKRYLDLPSNPIRTLSEIPYEMTYEPDTRVFKTSIHIGQRKLHNTEVSFLTDNVDPDKRAFVVYAGAAPSNHTGFLAQLFPNIKFILVDPSKFDVFEANPVMLRAIDGPEIDESLATDLINLVMTGESQIYIINDLFTVTLSKIIGKLIPHDQLFFISDIRTNATSGEDMPDVIDILWNSSQQYNWVSIMKPKKSMLKFRHPFYEEDISIFNEKSKLSPYKEDFELSKQFGIDFIENKNNGKLIYWDGEIHLQAYPGAISTETRLITSGEKLRDYGSQHQYENKLFYYNTIERCYALHKNDNADENLGFDNCNDCALENLYWKNYLRVYVKFVKPGTTVKTLVKKLSDITKRPLIRESHGKFFVNQRYPIKNLLEVVLIYNEKQDEKYNVWTMKKIEYENVKKSQQIAKYHENKRKRMDAKKKEFKDD